MAGLNPYYCALMLESTLPDQIKPLKLAKRSSSLTGKWSLDKFVRLTADAVDDVGEVSIKAEFSRDEGFPSLAGKATAGVKFECQRCLEPVVVTLEVDLNVAFVSTEEQMESIPEPFEAVLLEDEEISLIEVVEEELILALPLVAYHESCDAYEYRTEDEKAAEQQEIDQPEKENPFSVLEQLKGKLKSDD